MAKIVVALSSPAKTTEQSVKGDNQRKSVAVCQVNHFVPKLQKFISGHVKIAAVRIFNDVHGRVLNLSPHVQLGLVNSLENLKAPS